MAPASKLKQPHVTFSSYQHFWTYYITLWVIIIFKNPLERGLYHPFSRSYKRESRVVSCQEAKRKRKIIERVRKIDWEMGLLSFVLSKQGHPWLYYIVVQTLFLPTLALFTEITKFPAIVMSRFLSVNFFHQITWPELTNNKGGWQTEKIRCLNIVIRVHSVFMPCIERNIQNIANFSRNKNVYTLHHVF